MELWEVSKKENFAQFQEKLGSINIFPLDFHDTSADFVIRFPHFESL